jgi:hypothetical protein
MDFSRSSINPAGAFWYLAKPEPPAITLADIAEASANGSWVELKPIKGSENWNKRDMRNHVNTAFCDASILLKLRIYRGMVKRHRNLH